MKQEIQSWWAQNPMTYGLEHGTTIFPVDKEITEINFGSRKFFEQADKQFFDWDRPLHNEVGPFGKIFPYKEYKNRRVLEIGCGLGCMAMLWARQGAEITATDLNPIAVEQTKRRFELFSLKGDIRKEDANNLSFARESFDYVYSWGALHHSPHLEQSIVEMMRVLKPKGGFGIMLYNRHSIMYVYMTKYIEGFLHYENRFLKSLELASRYGDGARKEGNPYTWPITSSEVERILRPFSRDVWIELLGTELDSILKYMLPGIGMILPRCIKKVWARRFGWSLWIYGHKE